MASDVDEFRRLLTELERRPKLARDPRVLALLRKAAHRIAATSKSPPSAKPRFPGGGHRGRYLGLPRAVPWRLLGHFALDIVVLSSLLVFLPGLRWHDEQVFSFGSMSALAIFWCLVRAEVLRVAVIEILSWIFHCVWHAFLWTAEVFSRRLRRRWLELVEVGRHLREWRKTPRVARQHPVLMAFVADRFALDPPLLAELASVPDVTSVPGFLGRLGNPGLRWPGDRRLLPSAVRWVMLRGLRLRGQRDAEGASAAPAGNVPEPSPGRKANEDDLAQNREVSALRARIKLLQEEISKIQGWNVRKPEEERGRALAIRERVEEIERLRRRVEEVGRSRS